MSMSLLIDLFSHRQSRRSFLDYLPVGLLFSVTLIFHIWSKSSLFRFLFSFCFLFFMYTHRYVYVYMYTHIHLISFTVFKHIHKSGSAAEPFCHIRGQKKIYSGDDWKKALFVFGIFCLHGWWWCCGKEGRRRGRRKRRRPIFLPWQINGQLWEGHPSLCRWMTMMIVTI